MRFAQAPKAFAKSFPGARGLTDQILTALTEEMTQPGTWTSLRVQELIWQHGWIEAHPVGWQGCPKWAFFWGPVVACHCSCLVLPDFGMFLCVPFKINQPQRARNQRVCHVFRFRGCFCPEPKKKKANQSLSRKICVPATRVSRPKPRRAFAGGFAENRG